jgi:integrase
VTEKHDPSWIELKAAFETHMDQRKAVGKLQDSTVERYKITLREFERFLNEEKITLLRQVTKPLVEKFKVWRSDRIRKRNNSRGGSGLVLDAAVLHRTFAFALEAEMVEKNPVRMEGTPGENPIRGAEPFTAEELFQMREQAGDDTLAFLLLRWTGLRRSDAVALTWKEVNFKAKEVNRVTQKRGKRVILPIHTELLFALEAEYEIRKPKSSDRVLRNHETGTAFTRRRLYHHIVALGRRAGVPNAHPHRFRDTLAVDMLMKGANPYDVAKMLGDTIETIEKHYTPFVRELRERVRVILELGTGLENSAKSMSHRCHNLPGQKTKSQETEEIEAAGPVSRILSAGLLLRDDHSSGPRIAPRL